MHNFQTFKYGLSLLILPKFDGENMRTTEERIAETRVPIMDRGAHFDMSVKEYSGILRKVLVMASLLFDNGIITDDQYLELITFE